MGTQLKEAVVRLGCVGWDVVVGSKCGQGGAASGFYLVSAMQPFLSAAAAKQRGSQQGFNRVVVRLEIAVWAFWSGEELSLCSG